MCSSYCCIFFFKENPFKMFIYLLIYFRLCWVSIAACEHHCGEWGLLFPVAHGLLVLVASLVVERGL